MSNQATRLAEELKWLVKEVIDEFYIGTLREHQITEAIDALLALVQPAVSEEMEPFGWYYEHKNGDCDPQLVFERWSDPGRSKYVETRLFARAQHSSKGDEA